VVVPLVDGARSLGVLLLGRAAERYEEADEELALVIGTFVARLVARSAPVERQSSESSRAHVREPDREWEAEPQLTGS
jgi:GAF domain-containing protein